MAGVVCAIRGGPASQLTIEEAISLAKQTGQQLHFLYVVNLDFLERSASSRTHTIMAEMRQMGEFILLTAQSQAGDQDVDAIGTVRDGNVTMEIVRYCKEIAADYIVLGSPTHEGEENVFTIKKIKSFAEKLEGDSGAKVVFAGEIYNGA